MRNGFLNAKSRRLLIDRRLIIFFAFASLRWYYPTGSRGHPYLYLGISQPVQLPQQIYSLFYADSKNCQESFKIESSATEHPKSLGPWTLIFLTRMAFVKTPRPDLSLPVVLCVCLDIRKCKGPSCPAVEGSNVRLTPYRSCAA